MTALDFLQWPAMAVTVFSGWLVASQNKQRRNWGFWLFLMSNVLWVAWSWHDHAYALMVLQLVLAITNLRGVTKNEPRSQN